MRAQMTAEYLLLSLVALALAAVSIAALARIRESAERSLELARFESSVEGLHNAMEEACMMGYGNSREAEVLRKLTAEPLARGRACGVRFTDYYLANASAVRNCSCPLGGSATLHGKTAARNDGGTIALSSTR